MASISTRDFFASATSLQFDFTLEQYDAALRLKAEKKSSKPENVIKLDKWYQNDLPKKIKSRGKDAHLIHDELVQTIKWKLARGKYRPNLVNLVQMNTPRVVMNETKKAFRNLQKKNDLQAAANILCNLKGIGPAMASAVLAAGAPHVAPFMADECLLSMPDSDGLDYTMKEYMRYAEYIKACVERLNSQVGTIWTPHKVELAVWTHYILRDLKPELLIDMPEASAVPAAPAATDEEAAAVVNNGQLLDPNGEDTKSSLASSVGDEDSNAAKNFTASENEESQEAVAAPQEAAAAPTTETSTNNGNGENVAEVSVPVAEDLSVPVVEVSVPAVKEAPVEAAPVAVVTPEEEVPKTNGNSSAAASSPHSNGSAENNGNGNDEASKAKASSEADLLPKPNGELENGVNSSEKENSSNSNSAGTDLRTEEKINSSSSKRPAPEDEAAVTTESEAVVESKLDEPAAKKLKTCEGEAQQPPSEAAAAEEAPAPVAV